MTKKGSCAHDRKENKQVLLHSHVFAMALTFVYFNKCFLGLRSYDLNDCYSTITFEC